VAVSAPINGQPSLWNEIALFCQRLAYVQDANGGMRFVQPVGEFFAMQQAIAYYRVSTARQGRSGLGIEAQREAVVRFAAAEGLDLIAGFTEVETGKGSDAFDRRPQLV
jgi:hypothetical protein